MFMPVIVNGIVIGLELALIYNGDQLLYYWLIYGGSVALGEFVVMYPIGIPLYLALKDRIKHVG